MSKALFPNSTGRLPLADLSLSLIGVYIGELNHLEQVQVFKESIFR